jgi:hypothetical protein
MNSTTVTANPTAHLARTMIAALAPPDEILAPHAS